MWNQSWSGFKINFSDFINVPNVLNLFRTNQKSLFGSDPRWKHFSISWPFNIGETLNAILDLRSKIGLGLQENSISSYNSYNNQYVKSKMSSSDEQFVTSLMTKVMNHRQLVAPFSLDGLCVGNFSLNGSWMYCHMFNSIRPMKWSERVVSGASSPRA